MGTALRLFASAVILTLLLHYLPLEQLRAGLARISLRLALILLAGYMGVLVVGMLKWRLMVNQGGAQISHAQATRCYFSGLFSTLFLPSIVGGDMVRLGLLMTIARNRVGAVVGSLIDRMVDVAALASVTALGALLVPGALRPESRRVFQLLTASLAAAAALLVLIALLLPVRRLRYRVRRGLVRLRQAARSMAEQPRRVLLAYVLGIIAQTSFVVLTAGIAEACGLRVALSAWLFAWPLAKLAALLPVTQGGIGVREGALVGLLLPFGAPPALTMAVGLVWEALIISGGLLAGLIAFLLGRSAAAASTGGARN